MICRIYSLSHLHITYTQMPLRCKGKRNYSWTLYYARSFIHTFQIGYKLLRRLYVSTNFNCRPLKLAIHDDVITWEHDVFINLSLNQQLSKQWRRRWFRRHRAHYDVIVMTPTMNSTLRVQSVAYAYTVTFRSATTHATLCYRLNLKPCN